MRLVFIAVILLASLANVFGQVDESCTPSDNNIIALGGRVYICVKITASSGTYTYAFAVTVDKLTALSISNIKSILTNSQNVTIQLQYQSISTSQSIVLLVRQQILQDYQRGIHQNPISIVMQSTSGALQQIYYDKQDCTYCYASNNKTCIDQLCYSAGPITNDNNLIIYVSWIGTDIVGQHFISHTLRLSKINIFSQQDIFNAALTVTNY